MAIDKIQSESINLADNFAFTGTVTGAGGANTPAFLASSTGEVAVANTTTTKIDNYSVEILDTDGCFASSRFTPGVVGKYFIFGSANIFQDDSSDLKKSSWLFYGTTANDGITDEGNGSPNFLNQVSSTL